METVSSLPYHFNFDILRRIYFSCEVNYMLVAFQVLHGAERGETASLLLSPLRSTFKGKFGTDVTQYGSQFTFFLTSPLHAFCQMVGLISSDNNAVCWVTYSKLCRLILSNLVSSIHVLCSRIFTVMLIALYQLPSQSGKWYYVHPLALSWLGLKFYQTLFYEG